MYPNTPFQPASPQPVMTTPGMSPLAPPPPKKSKTLLIVTVILGLLVVGLGGLSIWALMNYMDQKNNVDTIVATAEADVRREVVTDYEARFLEFQKRPFSSFVGPDDYGRLTFDYPRFWSVYIETDASARGGTYEAFLNPEAVPPISSSTQVALRVTIETRGYDQVVSSYQSRVSGGDLNSRAVTINGEAATRLDGSFSNDIRGSAVIFRIRDKVVTLRTDARTFETDFNSIVDSISFNK